MRWVSQKLLSFYTILFMFLILSIIHVLKHQNLNNYYIILNCNSSSLGTILKLFIVKIKIHSKINNKKVW